MVSRRPVCDCEDVIVSRRPVCDVMDSRRPVWDVIDSRRPGGGLRDAMLELLVVAAPSVRL